MNTNNFKFQIIGSKIYDPNGQEYIVKGANMFAWENMDNVFNYVYTWGFNTLRIPNYLLGSYDAPHPNENGYSINHQIVDSFTSQGTVIMFDAHDRIGGYYEDEEWEILKDYWRDMAQEFKDNPYVWFNLHNEPGNDVAQPEKWVSYHRELIEIIRAEGAENLIVVNGEAWGQDRHNQVIADYGQEILEGNENILFDIHIYDQWNHLYDQSNELNLEGYLKTLQDKNFSIIIGEYGSSNEGHDTLQTSINAIEIAQEKEIGRIVWVAKGDDISDLTTGEGGHAEHFDGTNTEILTGLGDLVWSDLQRSEDLEQLPNYEVEETNNQLSSSTGVFQVGETGQVQFDFLFNGEWTQGELAIFSLSGMEEYIPGTQAFIQEAAARAISNSALGHILASEQQQEAARFSSADLAWEPDSNFEAGEYQGIKLFDLTPGENYGLFFIPNGTASEIANDPEIIWDSNSNFPLFSIPEANPGTVEGQIVAVDNFNTFAFENNRIDWNLGDKDYNDFVFQLQGVTTSVPQINDWINPERNWLMTEIGETILEYTESVYGIGTNYQFETGVLEVGESGQIQFEFLFNGESGQGELGIFSLEGLEAYIPGTEEFIQQAAIRAASNSTQGYILASEQQQQAARFSSVLPWEYDHNFNAGEYQGIDIFSLTPGGRYGLFLVPNGTVEDIANNPSIIWDSEATLPLFSLPEANPDVAEGQIVAVDNFNTFALEANRVDRDLGDRDYNDFVFQLQGVTTSVPNINDWIKPEMDWLTTDIGQEILEYTESVYGIGTNYQFNTGVIEVGESGQIQFEFLFNGESGQGELGIFSLEGLEAYIPGTEEFIQQAAIRAASNSTQGYILASEQQQQAARFSSVLPWEYDHNFNAGEYQGIDIFSLTPGGRYGLFLVPNGTVEDIVNEPSIIWDSEATLPLFSLPEANPDVAEGQIVAVDNFNTFALEANRVDRDLGDRDYNDFVFQLQGVTTSVPNINDWIKPEMDWLTTDIGQEILEYTESVYGIGTNYQFETGVIEVGATGEIQFEFLFNGEWTKSELGIFSLEGMEGYIPGTEEFIQEAAIRAASNSTQGYILASEHQQEAAKYSSGLPWEYNHNFNAGEYPGIKTFNLTPGDRYGLFLVPNATVADIVNQPDIIWDSEAALPLFSLPEANPDVAQGQMVAVDQFNTFAFEANRVDRNLGDKDYNDFVFQLQGVTTSVPQITDWINPERNWLTTDIGQEILNYGESVYGVGTNYQFNTGVLEVGESGEIQFEYLFNGEWTKGELGIFSLEGMEAYIPGTEEFIQEAAIRAVSNSTQGYILASEHQQEAAKYSSGLPWEYNHNFNAGEYQGIKLFDLTPGASYGMFFVPNGTAVEIANDPNIIWNSDSNFPLFSMLEADPDVAQGQIVAVDQFNTFAFEANRVDRDSGDRDYNDFVFQLQGVTTSVPQINDWIDPDKNWLTTEIGQEILDYSQSVYGITTNYQFETGVLEVGTSGEIQFEYLFNGEWTKGELGIFSLEGMEGYIPGTEEFIHQAAIRAASNSTQGYILASEHQQEAAKYSSGLPWEYNYNYNSGEYQGIKLFDLTPGDRYGLFLVPNATVTDIVNQPDIIWDSEAALPLFSLPEANPDVAQGQMVAVDGFNTFAFEANRVDRNSGDKDYNDFVFQLQGVTTSVPQINDWINPERNWLTTDIGQEILDYTESVYDICKNYHFETGVIEVGATGEIQFEFLFNGEWTKSELGIFSLEGMEDYIPGTEEFIQEAAIRAASNTTQGYILASEQQQQAAKYSSGLPWEYNYNYNAGEYQGIDIFGLTPGGRYGLFLVPNATVADIANNPSLIWDSEATLPLFSMPAANPDVAQGQVVAVDGFNTFAFEANRVDRDLSDRDYNDFVFQLQGVTTSVPQINDWIDPDKNWLTTEIGQEILDYSESVYGITTNYQFETGVIEVGATGEIQFEYLFNGEWTKSELGIFSLEGMEGYIPGTEEFIQEAAIRAASNSTQGYILASEHQQEAAKFSSGLPWEYNYNYNAGEYKGIKTFNLTPGDRYGLFLVPNAKVTDIVNEPSIVWDSNATLPLFSLPEANPDVAQGQMVAVDGFNTFAFEANRVDRNLGDLDYNDFVFQLQGATISVPQIEDWIDSERNWLTTDIGQEILDYSESVYDITTNSAEILAPKTMGEFGKISNFNHNSQTIELDNSYENPVVFALPLSRNGANPAIVRITEIQNDSFTAYLQEPEYSDGIHGSESFSYLVLEAGTWELDNGALLEVGTVDTNLVTTQGWENIDFNVDFADTPVILSQVQTNQDSEFVRTRQNYASIDGFSLSIEEEEALKNSGHGSETVGWLAIDSGQGNWGELEYQAGTTGKQVNDQGYNLSFAQDFAGELSLFASLASYYGADPAGLRYTDLSNTQVQLIIEEDKSLDNEIDHSKEIVDFLAISGAGDLTAIASEPLI